MFIVAFLFSEETIIAFEGQTFSHNLQPMQASLSTFLENLANRPKNLCKAPNGQMRLWNTSGLYLSVTSTDTTSQKGRIGRSICSSLLDSSIITMLINRDIHVKYPFFSHPGVFEV